MRVVVLVPVALDGSWRSARCWRRRQRPAQLTMVRGIVAARDAMRGSGVWGKAFYVFEAIVRRRVI